MKILIAGATGLVGSALVKAFANNHDISILTQRESVAKKQFSNLALLTWQTAAELKSGWIGDFDVVINLAGQNIGTKKWTTAIKEKIINSRVNASKKIAEWCVQAGQQAPRLLNASAIGIYGLQPSITAQNNLTYNEDSTPPKPTTDFLSAVGCDWENALLPAESAGVAVVKMRFGVVLSTNGGALAKMLPSFKLGLGGKIGSGKQPFSWISIEDLVNSIAWLLDHPEITGPINLVAPEIVSQASFAKCLAKALHRPALLPLPSFLIKALFGQMGEELLLNGQRVESQRLQQLGFSFTYPNLDAALTFLVK